MVTIEFEISDEAYELLIKIDKVKWIEYRDRYSTKEEFMESNSYKEGLRDLDWFLSRNHNGTQGYAWDLLGWGLIDHVEDAWNTTFELTHFGKETLSKHRTRDREINKVLSDEK